MKTKYGYEVTIYFDLSNEQFDLLTEAMQSHSDTKYYTTQGNFWYGNMNRNRWRKEGKPGDYEDGYIPYQCTTSQMDRYVIKALEPFVNYPIGNKEKQALGQKLYFDLMKVLREAIEHHNQLNQKQNDEYERKIQNISN